MTAQPIPKPPKTPTNADRCVNGNVAHGTTTNNAIAFHSSNRQYQQVSSAAEEHGWRSAAEIGAATVGSLYQRTPAQQAQRLSLVQ
jgi:hypothetical protein